MVANRLSRGPKHFDRANQTPRVIGMNLRCGDRVELRGFGAFSVRARGERVGRNPRTGESVNVAKKHLPFFKTGKELRERINQN